MDMVELKREARGKPGKGTGKAAQPLAQGEKPLSAKKQHFQAVIEAQPIVAMEVREKAINAYKAKLGRPCEYTEEIAEEILARMAEGESLRSICRDEHLPSRNAVYEWKAAIPSFGDRFARAQMAQSDSWIDDIIDEAETIEITGDAATDSAVINRAKVRIDARLRVAAKLNPNRYGDKIAHTGANGGPIAVATVTINARDLMPEQRDSLRAMLLAAKGEQNQGLSEDDGEAGE